VTLTAVGGSTVGDFNGDGNIDAADLTAWQAGFGATGVTHIQGDADGDADVDGADFLTWQRASGATPASTLVANVPEPSTIALLLTTLPFARRRTARRRRRRSFQLPHLRPANEHMRTPAA
jgi:hypothetical protein